MIAGLTPDLSSDLECMRQLLGRVLAAHVVAVLVLLTPPGMLAQLPDAPTPAESVQGSGNPTSEPAAIQNNLEREWTERAAAITAETLDTPTTGESSSVAGPEDVAFLEDDGLDAQQSFAPSPKRRFQPTLFLEHSVSGRSTWRGAGVASQLPGRCCVQCIRWICAVIPLRRHSRNI